MIDDEEDEDDEYTSCKIVLLGETGVGKTSIITRYISNSFSEVVMTSTGSSFFSRKIDFNDNIKVKLQIWDTAGQERYRSLAKIFYQSAAAAILVYDVTLRSSFENIKTYWANEIKKHTPENIILALAANKSDDYLNQEVNIDEGKELAKALNAIFICTSARNGIGIDDLFKMIAEKFVDPNKNFAMSYMNKDEILEQQNKLKREEAKKRQQILNKNKIKNKKKCC